MRRGTCIHFKGLTTSNRACAAGVNYEEAFGKQPGIFLRMPCIEAIERPLHGRGTYVKAGEQSKLEPMDRKGQAMIPCALRAAPGQMNKP